MKYLIFLFVFLLSSVSLAQTPKPMKSGKPYAMDLQNRLGGSGSCEGGQRIAVTTSERFVGTATTVPAGAVPNIPRLFKWGSNVHITCDAEAWFCFTMEDGLSSGDETITVISSLWLDDSLNATTEGLGGCFAVPSGGVRNQVVSPYQRLISVRDNKCDSAVAGSDHGYPCDDDADCWYTPTSGRCDPGQPDGVFLMYEGPATANCTVCVDL